MTSIYNWILNGRGRGKRYLLYLALIFAAMSSFTVYFSWNGLITSPNAKTFIAALPPLEIKDGVLVEPADTYQDIVWTSAGQKVGDINSYHLIIDTQSEDADLNAAPQNAIYLTKENAYILNNGNVTVQSLDKVPDVKVEQGQWQQILEKGNVRFSWALFFTLSIVLFVVFYIWSLVFALLSYFLTLFIPGEAYSFPVRRRLTVVSLVIAYIVILPLTFWGFYLGTFLFFFLVLVLMSFFLSGLPKSFIISVDS